jgi:hypothetical protein
MPTQWSKGEGNIVELLIGTRIRAKAFHFHPVQTQEITPHRHVAVPDLEKQGRRFYPFSLFISHCSSLSGPENKKPAAKKISGGLKPFVFATAWPL